MQVNSISEAEHTFFYEQRAVMENVDQCACPNLTDTTTDGTPMTTLMAKYLSMT